jgi:hypothetical protein
MANITTRIESLLKKTNRMKQQAVKGLLRTLKHIDQERKKRTADLEEAAKLVVRQLAELGHVGGISRVAGTKAKRAASSKKRIRRSPDDLKKLANGVIAYVKAHPESSGRDIRKTFSSVGQNIQSFVQQYGTAGKLRTTGKKAGMRYNVG